MSLLLQICKGKLTNPVSVFYLALKGPFGETNINPKIYRHEFTAEAMEAPFVELPMNSYVDCNKQLASKLINLRVIIFQVPK